MVNNTIGTIEFVGTDDTSGTIGATIVAHASSTWGGGSYPTDLRFSTMTGSTLSEAMAIDASGNVEVKNGGSLRAYRPGNSAYAGLFMDTAEDLYIRNSLQYQRHSNDSRGSNKNARTYTDNYR